MKINMTLEPGAIAPQIGSKYAAGADLYAYTDSPIIITPGNTVNIHTGVHLEIPEGYAGLIYARSGLATNTGLAPANKVGVVDADYRGELIVALHNHSNKPATVNARDRIAQLVITPFLKCEYNEVKKLNETVRGNDGFGSTGK